MLVDGVFVLYPENRKLLTGESRRIESPDGNPATGKFIGWLIVVLGLAAPVISAEKWWRFLDLADCSCGGETDCLHPTAFPQDDPHVQRLLAVLEQQKKNPAVSLTLLTTLLDFTDVGEIRVYIAKHASKDPVADAEKHFAALGLTQTRNRNAILIVIAPKSQNFATFGDVAIHRWGEPLQD